MIFHVNFKGEILKKIKKIKKKFKANAGVVKGAMSRHFCKITFKLKEASK